MKINDEIEYLNNLFTCSRYDYDCPFYKNGYCSTGNIADVIFCEIDFLNHMLKDNS